MALKGAKEIPLITLDGKRRSRKKEFSASRKAKEQREVQKKREVNPAPLCQKCMAEGGHTVNRVRKDAFGNYLEDCYEHALDRDQEALF